MKKIILGLLLIIFIDSISGGNEKYESVLPGVPHMGKMPTLKEELLWSKGYLPIPTHSVDVQNAAKLMVEEVNRISPKVDGKPMYKLFKVVQSKRQRLAIAFTYQLVVELQKVGQSNTEVHSMEVYVPLDKSMNALFYTHKIEKIKQTITEAFGKMKENVS